MCNCTEDFDLHELWKRLKAHFSNVGDALDDLRAPASAENLESLRESIGSRFTADLIESLEIHDGQVGDFFLFGDYRLRTSDEILAELKPGFLLSLLGKKKEVDEIMIADNGGNTSLTLDLGTGAVKDVWEDGDNVIFSSYRSFFERVLGDLDNGVLVYNNEVSGYVDKDDAEAYWPKPK